MIVPCVLHINCVFAGEWFLQTDPGGCLQAWAALVRAPAFPTTSHGSWCPQLQPDGHGLLPAHPSTAQGRSCSAGHPNVWVGQAPSRYWGSWTRRAKIWYIYFLIYWRNQSEWSPEMMEDLGPLLLWDDESTAALPNKVCVRFLYLSLVMVMQRSCRRSWSSYFFLSLSLSAMDERRSLLPKISCQDN